MIIESVKKLIGIKPGETTPDGRFSFTLTNCIGACDQAPAMLIDGDVHGDLTPEKVDALLARIAQLSAMQSTDGARLRILPALRRGHGNVDGT